MGRFDEVLERLNKDKVLLDQAQKERDEARSLAIKLEAALRHAHNDEGVCSCRHGCLLGSIPDDWREQSHA